MKAGVKIIGALLITAMLFCGCGSTGMAQSTNQTYDGFKCAIAGSSGKHIVYSVTIAERENISKEELEEFYDYLDDVDDTLTEGIYVLGYSKSSMDGTVSIYAYQFVNGVVVPEVTYITDRGDPKPNIKLNSETAPVKVVIDTTGVLSVDKIIPDVKKAAEKHKDDLNDYENGIRGTYLLCYDRKSDKLYYEFKINTTSYVKVDAKTGDFIEEYFWNGDMED